MVIKMKRKILGAVTALLCTVGLLGAVGASAMTAELDFEDVSSIADIKGSGKFFSTDTSANANSTSVDTETMGTYANKYFTIKGNGTSKNVMVSQPILDNDVTVVTARLKFMSGAQGGLVLRSGKEQYLAVNNGGGTNLRLLNKDSCYLTGYENTWVDVRYVITKNSDKSKADIQGYMMKTGQPDTMITDSLNDFDIDESTHLRFQVEAKDADKKASIDNLVVKSYNAAEATTLVNEDFEQFAAGVQSGNLFRLSPNSALRTVDDSSLERISIVDDKGNKYLSIKGDSAKTPLLYDFVIRNSQYNTSVISFDMKVPTAASGDKVYLRPKNGGEYPLVEFTGENTVRVMSYDINGLAAKLKNGFVHFEFVLKQDTNINGTGINTSLTAYADGEKTEERNWTSSVIFTDLRVLAAANSEIGLDNLTLSIPGESEPPQEPEPLVTGFSCSIDGEPITNGKFAPGKEIMFNFTAESNVSQGAKVCAIAAQFNNDNQLLRLTAIPIIIDGIGYASKSEKLDISDETATIKLFAWDKNQCPTREAQILTPYSREKIESLNLYYPGYTNKAVTFSYDDGIYAADSVLVPLFNKYGIKGSFNLIGNKIPTDETELANFKKLYEGHEVTNHSQTHPKINLESSGITINDAFNDIINGRNSIKAVFGDSFNTAKWGFVWPYARPEGRKAESDKPYVTELEEKLAAEGAVYIRTVSSTGRFDLPQNWLLWNPTSKDIDTNKSIFYMEKYTDEFLQDTKSGLRLLYLWGHASELSLNGGVGFVKLENIFKKLTADGVNIWSATNMEIYDYVNAARAITINGTRVENPSDTDVYISINGIRTVVPAHGHAGL